VLGHDERGGGIKFVYEPGAQYRIAVFRGDIDDSLLFTSYAELIDAADFNPGLNDLVDLRSVCHLDLSPDGLLRLVGKISKLDGLGYRTRVAFVVSSQVSYGVSRMYAKMRESCPGSTEEIRIFRDYNEAVAWLKASF